MQRSVIGGLHQTAFLQVGSADARTTNDLSERCHTATLSVDRGRELQDDYYHNQNG